jgi:hypothetical protein
MPCRPPGPGRGWFSRPDRGRLMGRPKGSTQCGFSLPVPGDSGRQREAGEKFREGRRKPHRNSRSPAVAKRGHPKSGSQPEMGRDKHRCYAGSGCDPPASKLLKSLFTGSPARGATPFCTPQACSAAPFSDALRTRRSDPSSYLAAIAQTNSANAAVDEIVRTWFHQVQSLR